MLIFLIVSIGLIIILAFYLKNPKTRGKHGENKVKRLIGRTIENRQYIINDLIVAYEGKTSQIDHIVINRRGVFVIETKNYSGEIYGSEHQLEWTQVLAHGNVKNKIYNPLKQNAAHVYHIKRIIGKLPVYSLVVFVQNNVSHIEANNVIPLSELRKALHYGKNILSIEQMKTAFVALSKSRSDITTKEHIRNIKERQRNLERGICPRCGGKLILRKGKSGDFLGCSNYPKCNFKKADSLTQRKSKL